MKIKITPKIKKTPKLKTIWIWKIFKKMIITQKIFFLLWDILHFWGHFHLCFSFYFWGCLHIWCHPHFRFVFIFWVIFISGFVFIHGDISYFGFLYFRGTVEHCTKLYFKVSQKLRNWKHESVHKIDWNLFIHHSKSSVVTTFLSKTFITIKVLEH